MTRNYGLMRIVKEAREGSPLTSDEQKLLIKYYNDTYGDYEADSPEAEDAAQELAEDLRYGVTMREKSDTDSTVPDKDAPTGDDNEVIDRDSIDLDLAVPDDTESFTSWVSQHVKDAARKAGGFMGSLKNKVQDSWEEYTEDVRVPVVEETVETGVITEQPTEVKDDTTGGNTSSKHGIAHTVKKVVTGQRSGKNGVMRIVGSFVDGVLGRPSAIDDNATIEYVDYDHDCKYRSRFGVLMKVLAVIGGLALVRAGIDSLRPRR